MLGVVIRLVGNPLSSGLVTVLFAIGAIGNFTYYQLKVAPAAQALSKLASEQALQNSNASADTNPAPHTSDSSAPV